MTIRSSVNFSQKVGPLVKKYGNTYGVKNTCSLGVILIDRLRPDLREELMNLIGGDADLTHIHVALDMAETKVVSDMIELKKRVRKADRDREKELNPKHSTSKQGTME